MAQDAIVIRGAREHNLADVDVDIPRDKLVVITGLSGSGKSSLAFDTIYAEGQRRYVESLSSYARQFLGQMDKPDLALGEGPRHGGDDAGTVAAENGDDRAAGGGLLGGVGDVRHGFLLGLDTDRCSNSSWSAPSLTAPT